jgi:hypothetical protein
MDEQRRPFKTIRAVIVGNTATPGLKRRVVRADKRDFR